ncbi:osmotically-inducible lipoprotein OsmE [Pseudomonas sp. PDM15]|jgi:osmotically inducible lipoprotein OsmE|uniref:osmotically-inducible lipoprotein OsmE n=1 Tax=Pseudomonas sp. PDM15 TaxID=2769303 RepID=UPI001786C86E|nr:osmotically-inducible lipoprotein OsmE [Pseudomonas sp. PDM15]MBD9425921.1 osmotically-inducible lipoprotein OsmE [Pseudomonas sp. PDM15]
MYKHTLAILGLAAAVTGCSTMENPADYATYRHEPLVQDVRDGMTKDEVLTIGGPPSSEVQNTVTAGTCNNYILNVDGKEQPYYVTFTSEGRVEGKGFMTCEQHQDNKRRL